MSIPERHTLYRDLIDNVHRELERVGTDIDGLKRMADEMRAKPAELRESLLELGRSSVELAEVASRSYVHANGFAKVVLRVDDQDRYGIRLHVWPPEDRGLAVDSDPHGHRWEFASWIVTGTLREITFAESPHGEWFERCDYGRDHRGSAYLRANGSARLAPVRTIDRSAGTVYARSRSVLHTAEPHGGGLVASLVLQGSKSFTSTPVYLRPGIPAENDERELRPDELGSLLAAVTAAIT